MFLEYEPKRKVHAKIPQINSAMVITGVIECADAVLYLDGKQYDYLMRKMAQRYCATIRRGDSTGADTDDEIELYYADPNIAAEAAVRAGMFEIIDTGVFTKINTEMASLAPSSVFSFVTESGEEATDFAAEIEAARQIGQFNSRLLRAEQIACACGCSAMLIQIIGGRLNYQPIVPTSIRFLFAPTIVEDDEERPADSMLIDDAVAVIIQMESEKFCALFGRSEEYPNGRQVVYRTTQWQDIPQIIGAGDTVDADGQPYNPLTMLQNVTDDYSTPEYPVSLWYGTGRQIGTTLLPCDLSTWKNSVEVDLAACRVMTASLKSATGMIVFSAQAGSSPVAPENVGEGLTALKPGQSLNVINVPAINSKYASEFVQDVSAMITEASGVPSYKLGMSKMTLIPSGVALRELDKPAVKSRDRRRSLNDSNMARIFDIECCLARMASDDYSIGAGITQVWTIKEETYYQDEASQTVADVAKLNDMKVVGRRELYRKYNEGADSLTDGQVDERLQALDIPEAAPEPALGRFAALR
jgi:hypothetical protein